MPAEGVPPGVLQGAVEMRSIEHFAPILSGPASRQAPFSNSGEAAEAESDAGELEEEDAEERAGGCSREPDALVAEENMNAEYLIGLDESPEDCSVAKLAAFRAKLRAISEHSRKLATAARRQVQATDMPEAQMEFAADAAAAAADHRSVCRPAYARKAHGHLLPGARWAAGKGRGSKAACCWRRGPKSDPKV